MNFQNVSRLSFILEQLQVLDGKNICRFKMKKMAHNPFLFFRGSVNLFYADIKSGVLPVPINSTYLPLTTIVGDCHLANFGFFTEESSASNSVIFAVNDFDDACIGHSVWDLLRFMVSVHLIQELAMGIVQKRYISEESELLMLQPMSEVGISSAINRFISAYFETLTYIIQKPSNRQSEITQFEHSDFMTKQWKKSKKRAPQGDTFLVKSTLAKAVDFHLKPPKFNVNNKKFRSVSSEDFLLLTLVFRPYVDDEILDIVQRVDAGTGSINMKRFYLLVGPSDYQSTDDLPLCHIVELKQQRSASPIHYFPDLSPINKLNPAHLTIDCQRKMQQNPDLVLDEVYWQEKYWLVRSRHNVRLNIDLETLALAKSTPLADQRISEYSESCGKALALAHSRGDRRSTLFEQSSVAMLSTLKTELSTIAQQYSQQVIADYKLFSDYVVGD